MLSLARFLRIKKPRHTRRGRAMSLGHRVERDAVFHSQQIIERPEIN